MAKPSSSNNQQHAKVQSRAARVAASQGKGSTLKCLSGETPNEEAQAVETSQSASSMTMHRDLKRDLKGGSGVKSTSRTSRASPSGTAAAMKSLAQRHAASLRPSLSIDEISQEARRIVMENDATALAALIDGLTAERGVAERSKHIDEILAVKPDMFVAFIDRFVQLILSPHKKAAQSAASVLPVMAKLAPARVAKHLSVLIEGFDQATEGGRDGLVSTFAALCTASVAYQKRLEPVLEKALEVAEPKSLRRWAEVILPALKGEPHARARAVVEGRLPRIPRSLALPIATFLGVKLRPGSQTG